MKITGIISEYNPFHLGHKYQIEELKNKVNTNIIAIMSGDFVQRGECAIIDKYDRAKIAIQNGVDLVIELPFYYSLQSAENFAKGGVKILNHLNIVDYLCFGYECDNMEDLFKVSNFQEEYKNEIDNLLKEFINTGSSYAVAYKDACLEINKKYQTLETLENFFTSNNILSIEYIKGINSLNSKIIPLPIKRKGENYNSENYNSSQQVSASAIRFAIYNDEIEKIKKFVDNSTFKLICNSLIENKIPNDEILYSILKYNILSDNINPEKIVNYENGLLNLIRKKIFEYDDYNNLIDSIQSKRYKKVRIKRFILNYLLNVDKEIQNLYTNEIPYIKVLALNKSGRNILRKIKEKTDIEIITKPKDYNKLNSIGKRIYEIEEKARKLYNLFTNHPMNKGYIDFYIDL